MNALCRRLWRYDDIPTMGKVRNIWEKYINQQAAWITSDLSGLTLNRRKVITALAYQPSNEPQGQAFSKRADLTPSGIKKGLADLEKLDMIYKKNGFYCVQDPAMAYFIRKNA